MVGLPSKVVCSKSGEEDGLKLKEIYCITIKNKV